MLVEVLVVYSESYEAQTRYGLDGPWVESRWGRDFLFQSRPALEPNNLLYDGYRVYFPVVKRPGRGVGHLPPSSAKVKERVELTSPPFWVIMATSGVKCIFLQSSVEVA
jgi:hypothetical protein